MYEWGEQLVKKLEKPLVKRQLKRRFESFIDGCEEQVNDIDLELHNLQFKLKSFEHYDLNRVCELELKKQKILETKQIAERHFKEMFDEKDKD